MLFDPFVLRDFPVEDLLWILNTFAGQIFAFRDDANAHHIVVQRDVPKPTFLRNEGNGRSASVDARVTQGPAIVSPDCDFVQLGIAHPPLVADRGKSLASAAIDRDRRKKFSDSPGLILRAYTDYTIAIADQLLDRGFFEDNGTVLTSLIQGHDVKFRAEHLPGLRDILVVAIEKIERL